MPCVPQTSLMLSYRVYITAHSYSLNLSFFTVVEAILKSNQASTCKQGYRLPCTFRYLDYNISRSLNHWVIDYLAFVWKLSYFSRCWVWLLNTGTTTCTEYIMYTFIDIIIIFYRVQRWAPLWGYTCLPFKTFLASSCSFVCLG
jgi:hypothetical protein